MNAGDIRDMHAAECGRQRRPNPCWGWGASGFAGASTDRWACSGCGSRQKGSTATAPEWRAGLCADCAVLEHVRRGSCPILAPVAS